MHTMQEHNTFPGKVYAVTCASGCTITDNKGRTLGECEAGKQTLVVATSDKLITSADALVTATFNYAPAKAKALGLLGGGTDTLPKGYLAAEFLETNGAQYVNIPIVCGYDAEIEMTANVLPQTFASTPGLFSNEGVSGYSASKRFGLLFSSNYYNVRADFGASVLDNHFDGIADTIKVYKLNKQGLHIDGSLVVTITASEFSGTTTRFFARNAARISARFYKASIKTDTQKAEIIPAIDALGVPCLYDKKSKQPFYNSGAAPFIVGLTCRQAVQLAKLPAGGGTLTVSMPSNWQEDEGVVNALATAEAKGWVFTYQTYEAEAGAVSTFALRRIWVRKTQSEHGGYVSADGSRWLVDWCAGMIGADPQEHGYEPFRSVDAAVAYWELEPWVAPEEELLTEH